MTSYRWAVRRRHYAQEKAPLAAVEAPIHPLSSSTGSVAKIRKSVSSPLSIGDPLGFSLDGADPLSRFADADGTEPPQLQSIGASSAGADVTFRRWLEHRTALLARFTTAEKLSITSSFLQGGEKLVVQRQIGDRTRHRLQQLDEREDDLSEHGGLSQEDYIRTIERIADELQQAWRLDQRVKALKIVIQCAKLLLETHPMAFYPSKFALITDVLDQFGRLVFERIAEKGRISLAGDRLPDNFRSEFLPEDARETCRNWIFKIASIRELLPRLYVETAALKCYAYLEANEFSETLVRLSRTLRGVGDPLVAAYARSYLMRVGCERVAQPQSFIQHNIHDLLLSYHQLWSASTAKELAAHRVDPLLYQSLYTPVLDWMLQVAADHHLSQRQLNEIYEHCCRVDHPGLLWQSVIQKLPAEMVEQRALELAASVAAMAPSANRFGPAPANLMRVLGLSVSGNAAGGQTDPLRLLNTVWPFIVDLKELDAYVPCLEAWIPYVVRYLGRLEVNMILNDVVARCSPKAEAHHVTHLTNIVEALVGVDQADPHAMLTNEKFVGLIDLFPEGRSKAEVSRAVLERFLHLQMRPLSNPILVDNLVRIAGNVHDTLNATSVEDEKRQIGELVIRLIDLVDFGRDFQQQLSFCGDARAAFTNLDPVLAHLVQCVNRLSSRMRRLVAGGQHGKRTGHFVRACGAFAYITVPAIDCALTRFRLYVLSGQVALTNECLGQADACFEGAVNVVAEVPPGDESLLTGHLCDLLSTLLVHPEAPDQSDRLSLLRRLLRTVRTYTNGHQLPKMRHTVYLQALRLLSAMAQPLYIYHVPSVESNDRLYIGDEEFQIQIGQNCAAILTELLNDLKSLGTSHQHRQQASLCLDLFSVLISTADLQDADLFQLAGHLFKLAQRHGQCDVDNARRLIDAVQRRAIDDPVLADLASRLCLSS